MNTLPIRARDVQVAHIYQARCQRPRCEYAGELLGSYQEANTDRQAHLREHAERPGQVMRHHDGLLVWTADRQ